MTTEQNANALRPATGAMVMVSIPNEVARLKEGVQWKSGDRHAVSIVKDHPLNVLLMVLKKGAKLHEHHAKGPIALQVVSGSIRFRAVKECLVSAGELIGLDRNVPHSVEALEESAIILITAID
jgi:quercetin dioxygenase-like cupin family protein